jgi:hypothetical protein
MKTHEASDFVESLSLARRAMPAGPNENEWNSYSLIATPLKEATPTEFEVATGVRSP